MEPREKLTCCVDVSGIPYQCIRYWVMDKSNNVVAEGYSSTLDWVRHDAGGYHTKTEFDRRYPQGWDIEFLF